jgi:hypothetical protein
MNLTATFAHLLIAAAASHPPSASASSNEDAETAPLIIYARETPATAAMRVAKTAHQHRLVLLELVSAALRSHPTTSAFTASMGFRAPDLELVHPAELTPDLKLPAMELPKRRPPVPSLPPGS